MMSGVVGVCAARSAKPLRAQQTRSRKTLLSVPLELGGDWGSTPPEAAQRVLLRVRKICLSGLKLLSDQQPEKLRIENHTGGSPAIWLHDDQPAAAWIIVDIGPRDWCKLAYQFGHELGHVLCNSWIRSAQPGPPTQWLEESMVEAFSIRGLGLLAASWEEDPPFTGDKAFAAAIRQYRANLMEKDKPAADIASWFRAHRSELESDHPAAKEPAVGAILAVLENDKKCVEDLAAANRWPARTHVPIENYLANWEISCTEIGAPNRLPAQLRQLFKVER
jgi:hypothetical protein